MSPSCCYLRQRQRKDRAVAGIVHDKREPAAEAHIDHRAADCLSLRPRVLRATLHRPLQRGYHNRIRPGLLAAEHLHSVVLRAIRDTVCLAHDGR